MNGQIFFLGSRLIVTCIFYKKLYFLENNVPLFQRLKVEFSFKCKGKMMRVSELVQDGLGIQAMFL
jgi:hypothetical protein